MPIFTDFHAWKRRDTTARCRPDKCCHIAGTEKFYPFQQNGYSNALEMLIQVSNMTSCVILENPLLHLLKMDADY